ncbi:IS66 family transposase [Lacrimispora sp. BS-2]|uniref:IS66 family transposase n=1 Tax=Lacrimispora sp. BS-2 TaxID=3151850 RepID=A0AAU7PUQ0_9FIRM
MNKSTITPDELNKLPKDLLISMYMQLNESFTVIREQNERIQSQNDQLMKKISGLQENLAVLTQQRFGRKTEQTSQINGQLSFDLDNSCVLNEAEKTVEDGIPKEPDIETVMIIKQRKSKGKRETDLKDIDTVVEEHTLSDERLEALFPFGYHRLPNEVYKDLEYIPAKFLVHEHHVAIYAGKNDTGIIRADRPERLLKNSILTPALAASIFNAKYVNAVPINRLSEEFLRNDVRISRQVMAGWMIRLSERYLGPVYREMHRRILESRLIHCDETPFKVVDDGRSPNSKNYMWVYHTSTRYGSPPIFLYEYQPTRKADNPRRFLEGYSGILMTDGYQVYHTLANERPDELKVAGCWAHAKRRWTELIKSIGKGTANGLIADEANRRISAIYHIDNMYKEASAEERLDNRKKSVKPLVDAYFEWLKRLQARPDIDKGSKTYGAITYSLNQERYLRTFLEDEMIPLDNNDAERSIKAFCVGKHNWHIVDSVNGAHASGVLYSIAETAKANGLKPYEYFRYLLEQMLIHLDDEPKDYIGDLVPWSVKIPECCKKLKK